MTDFVIMPSADYKAACDKIREKSGKADLIKSGDLATEIEEVAGSAGASLDACTVTLKNEDGIVWYAAGTALVDNAEAPLCMINDGYNYCVNEYVLDNLHDAEWDASEARFTLAKGSFFHAVIDNSCFGGVELSGNCEIADYVYEGANDIIIYSFKISGNCEIEIV